VCGWRTSLCGVDVGVCTPTSGETGHRCISYTLHTHRCTHRRTDAPFWKRGLRRRRRRERRRGRGYQELDVLLQMRDSLCAANVSAHVESQLARARACCVCAAPSAWVNHLISNDFKRDLTTWQKRPLRYASYRPNDKRLLNFCIETTKKIPCKYFVL
jgi:hypothetical protein